jgi:hypothetical protein
VFQGLLDTIERGLDWVFGRPSAHILWTVCLIELGFIIGSRISVGLLGPGGRRL